MAPQKRKRNDRNSVDSGDNRPSPHRPSNTNLAQHDRDGNMGRGGPGGGNRRQSRGNNRGPPRGRNDRRNSSDSNAPAFTVPSRGTPGPMSPPAPRPSSSSQSQPPQQTPVAAPSPLLAASSPMPEEPRPEPEPYDYSHITDERMSAWTTNGRTEVVEAAKQALDDVDILDLSTIFQELIRASMDRRLDAIDAGTCVKEILGSNTAIEGAAGDCDASALFLDCLSIITDSEPFDTALQRMVTATGISPILARRILDGQLLEKLGLTRNTFVRTGIRQTTNLLYRQSNHNLLREETEGYSKLVTELFTTSGSEPPTSEVVEETFERVKGLIGTFDLDVGRVLDVTLDVFAAVLIKQFRFFIKFLRVSSWWPRDSGLNGLSVEGYKGGGLPRWALPGSSGWAATAEEEEEAAPKREERDKKFWERARKVGTDAFFELGGRHIIDPETKELLLAQKSEVNANIGPDRQWIEATGTAPPPGNRVAAQLLGFKLRFYASEAREEEDQFPPNLIYLAALLIKIGFISLRDLYPHIWPLDEDMEAVKELRMKELAEKERLSRPGGGKNALMMAGALADDTLPNGGRTRDAGPAKADSATVAPSASEDTDKTKLPEPEDQKVKLLTNLLTIGAIPESLFILGRFPWLPEAYPEILDLLHRILHHSVSKVFEASQIPGIPSSSHTLKKSVDFDQSSAPKGQVRRSETTPRRPLRWPFPDKYDVHEAHVYRFYWDEWADNIPVCHNVDDIFTLCSTLLNYSGVNIGKDASLLSKLYSIGNKSLAEDRSEVNLARWQDLLKRLLVPALSLTKENTNAANELYEMLRYYPVHVRFTLYAEWFEGQTSRLPVMMAAFKRTHRETLNTMKRISKANVPVMARSLAKLAYASPGVVFKVALSQIEAYNNLIEVVVECARYFTDLGYDVLIWSLLSSLGGKSRNRTRSDDVLLTSRWLIALSKFSGNAFKRYSIMNPAPVIQYIHDQLYQGNATDLIILEELISQMAGIISNTDFTDSQLLSMTGGEKLRRQTLINLQDRRFDSEKTAKRFMRSLLETKLAAPILVSIAQHRQSAAFRIPDDEAHIKYLATLIDETQRILIQYLDLLRSNLSIDDFDAIVPDTAQLLSEYGLDPNLAFLIGRASFAHRITVSLQAASKPQSKLNASTPETDIEGDVSMDTLEPIESSTIDGVSTASPVPADIWQETLAPLMAAVKHALPEPIWSLLSPEFYVVFWQLALSDIHLPMDSYQSENSRLTREISDTIKDRTDMTRKGVDERDKKRRGLEATKDELMKESKQQLMNYERVRARLNKEKQNWFVNTEVNPNFVHDALLEHCFLPRLLLSPSDVDYCFKLIKFLHNNGTPQFRTLCLYQRIFKPNRLRALIFSCTIREAENLGRFLKQILGDLSRWHSSKALYEKEAYGQNRDLPGFAKKLGKDHKPEVFLEFEDFRRWVFSSHKALNTALKTCLGGMEWMHIRNAITVLKAVVEHFPAINFMGTYFQTTLMKIGAREKTTDKNPNGRDDLSLLANAVLPDLKKRESKWVMPQAFATNLGDLSSQMNGLGNASQTPHSTTTAKTILKPTAPEFKPGARITSNGSSTPKRSAGIEVEDGEVDDAKVSAASNLGGDESTITQHLASTVVASAAANTALPVREEILSRAATPKASTTLPSQPGQPPRSEIVRNVSSGAVLDKPPPGLPNRPDVPIPGRGERHPPPRLDDRRGDRLGGSLRDRNRDLMNPDRRPVDSLAREPGRYSERSGPHERDRERDRLEPPRRLAEPIRDARDGRDRERSMGDPARLLDFNGRPSRTDPLPPSRLAATDAERGTLPNPERASLISPNEVPINPARAALIHGSSEPPRSDSSRAGRDDIRGRPSSRPHSPRRSERPGDHSDGRRHDRGPSGRYPGPELEFNRGRHDDQLPSAAARTDRAGNRGPDRSQRDLSAAFQPTQPPPRSVDPDHGRLTTQDASYGRLEDPITDSSGPPSGPRGGPRERDSRNGRARQVNAPQIRDESRPSGVDFARPPTPDRPPPTGPAGAARNPRRSASGQFDTPSANARSVVPPVSGAPLSPLPPPPPLGVHPSRLGKIENTIPTSGHTVHPSRLNSINTDPEPNRPPPPIQTNLRHEASVPSPMSGLAPAGPRAQAQAHQSLASSSVGPNGFSAPTGPSSTERTRTPRERQGHHLAGIQSTLLQAGQQMAPDRTSDTRIRGRGGRSGPGFDSHPSSTPSTPLSAIPADMRDGPTDRDRELINPDRNDIVLSRGTNGVDSDHGRQDTRSGPRGHDSMPAPERPHRPSRHSSHHNSRSMSPGHDSQRPIRERDPLDDPAREHRGRRGESGRERHQGGERELGRRDGRDGDKGRDMPPRMATEPPWGGESGGGPDRGGRSHDMRQPGGGENRRDSRSSRDADGGSGRKRRGDEGAMGMDRGHEKRPRR